MANLSDKEILKAWKHFIKTYGKNADLACLIINMFTTINSMRGALTVAYADKGYSPKEASQNVEDLAFPESTTIDMLSLFFNISKRVDPKQLEDAFYYDIRIMKLFQ